jgi:mannose/fructose/N-acetylgalactosamine-specific phosphotransferase system component IID
MNKDDKGTIGAGDLLSVLWRALFIQASWSFERMQSIGFACAIQPVLRKLYPDQAEYESRLKLHMDYFNTQPYLASFILGATVRREQDRAFDRTAAADISGLKSSLMGPLGALGDSFFWGALKPLAAVVATAFLITGAWWAPLLFLAVFNTWHVGLRAATLFWGYASGGDPVDLMARYPFTKMAKRFKVISLCVLGGILGTLPAWQPEFKPDIAVHGVFLALFGLACMLTMIAFLRSGSSPVKLMLGLAAICLALAYGGVV